MVMTSFIPSVPFISCVGAGFRNQAGSMPPRDRFAQQRGQGGHQTGGAIELVGCLHRNHAHLSPMLRARSGAETLGPAVAGVGEPAPCAIGSIPDRVGRDDVGGGARRRIHDQVAVEVVQVMRLGALVRVWRIVQPDDARVQQCNRRCPPGTPLYFG